MAHILFRMGIAPVRTASRISLELASKLVAPKLSRSSISRCCSTREVSIALIERDTLFIMFPRSIPTIGMTYCGSHHGFERIKKPKENTETITIFNIIPTNVKLLCPLNEYLDLDAASREASNTMKQTYNIISHHRSSPSTNIGSRISPKIDSCTNVLTIPTKIGISSSNPVDLEMRAMMTSGIMEINNVPTDNFTSGSPI
mmetsp:Transcript_22975/g.32155  ORF Transcript_22975/g.32155 Transcript_22975/m.32155 type:complete len:201 (+) Transcript_22975:1171-1773(+)